MNLFYIYIILTVLTRASLLHRCTGVAPLNNTWSSVCGNCVCEVSGSAAHRGKWCKRAPRQATSQIVFEKHAVWLHSRWSWLPEGAWPHVRGRGWLGWFGVCTDGQRTPGSYAPPLTSYSCHQLAATVVGTGQGHVIEGWSIWVGLCIGVCIIWRPNSGFLLTVLHQIFGGCYSHLTGKGTCTESESLPFDSPTHLPKFLHSIDTSRSLSHCFYHVTPKRIFVEPTQKRQARACIWAYTELPATRTLNPIGKDSSPAIALLTKRSCTVGYTNCSSICLPPRYGRLSQPVCRGDRTRALLRGEVIGKYWYEGSQLVNDFLTGV
jgi:hypothetical protein